MSGLNGNLVMCVAVLFFFSAPPPSPIMAEEKAAVKSGVDFRAAYEDAVQHDARLDAAEARHEYYRQEVEKTEAGFMPSVNVSLMRGRNATNSESVGILGPVEREQYYNTKNYGIALRQPLFNLVTVESFKKAKALEAKSAAELNAEQSELIVRTAEEYFTVLFSLESREYAAVKTAAAREAVEQARRALNAGEGTVTELRAAEADLKLASAEELRAAADLDQAVSELSRLIGYTPVRLYGLDPFALRRSMDDRRSLMQWIEQAQRSSPLVDAAKQEVRVAHREREKNRAEFYPKLDLHAGRTYSESDNNYSIGTIYDTYSLNVRLEMPLYTGGYTSAAVRQAAAGMIEAEARLREVERKTAADVSKYFRELHAGYAGMEAYEKAVASARVTIEAARKGLRYGTSTKAEVEHARERLHYALIELARERYRVILNKLMLEHAAGQLSVDDVMTVNSWLRRKPVALPAVDADS